MNWTWKLFNRRWHANLGIFSAITLGVIALSCFFIAHAEKGGVRKTLEQIHFGKFLSPNLRWIWIDSQGAMLLGLVVSGWFMHYKAKKKRVEESAPGAPSGSLLVLFDSRTGAAEKLARKFNAEAEARGFRAFVTDMAHYRHADLEAERWLFVITGAPADAPVNAKTFRQFVADKKAPRLKETGFAVLAIAESPDAKVGDDLDQRFVQLGASRLHPRTTCAADDEKAAQAWMNSILAKLAAKAKLAQRAVREPKSENSPASAPQSRAAESRQAEVTAPR
jgi:sulfite reductase alpha subunit-like flavoprotein